MRVTCVIASLTSGGAERVMTTMANAWAGRGWPVTILTIADTPPFYPLDPRVAHRALSLAGASTNPVLAVRNNLRRLLRLRRELRASRPDVVIGFLDTTNVQTLLATRGLGRPVVVMEHTDPSLIRLGRAWHRLRLVTYPWASRVVVLSEAVKAYFPPSLHPKIVMLPNPILVEPAGTVVRPERKQLVSIGRFGPEKGFDLLLDAFARVAPAHPDWELVIWGDGELRPELEAQRERLGLTDRVRLPGRTREPHDRLREADLYVLSSRREAFPMALAEAMACGLPAVAFDLPSGPRSIIRDGVDGVLVPNGDMPALARALDSLMGDEPCRRRLAARAPEVLERFGVDRVMSQWDALLDEVMAR